jgi:branched-chain amino acid transport system substrate-binding protein
MIIKRIITGAWFIPALVFCLFGGLPNPVKASAPSDSIRIGMLITDSRYTAAYKGAELAVRAANKAGGIRGRPLKIILKSMEGPWGTGSKQAVDLVFKEKVVAMLGSTDGRNAHLVEQVAAKSKVPFISAWSSDPTLALAFVPWFFNCVPGNIVQSEALVKEYFKSGAETKMLIVSDSVYDSASAVKYLLRANSNNRFQDPVRLIYRGTEASSAEIARNIKQSGAKAVVVLVQPESAAYVIRRISIECPGIKIYSSAGILDENILSEDRMKDLIDLQFVALPDLSFGKGEAFVKTYRTAWGTGPGPVAAYAFDGMNLLIEAIKTGGSDEEGIQTALMKMKLEGVSGTISFDEHGSRDGVPSLLHIKLIGQAAK